MIFRKLNLQVDYPKLEELWKNSKAGEAMPLDMLPTDGIVAEEDGEIKGAVFMWLATNSMISFIGFPVLDVELNWQRKETLNELFKEAEVISKYLGFRYVFHYSGLDHMTKFLEDERDYVIGDLDVTNLIKKL